MFESCVGFRTLSPAHCMWLWLISWTNSRIRFQNLKLQASVVLIVERPFWLQAVNSSNHRTVLKSLGTWLGRFRLRIPPFTFLCPDTEFGANLSDHSSFQPIDLLACFVCMLSTGAAGLITVGRDYPLKSRGLCKWSVALCPALVAQPESLEKGSNVGTYLRRDGWGLQSLYLPDWSADYLGGVNGSKSPLILLRGLQYQNMCGKQSVNFISMSFQFISQPLVLTGNFFKSRVLCD